MTPLVKICGLRTAETLEAALTAGADMVGFVRFTSSPRHVELSRGRDLSAAARGRAQRVVLLVDPDDRAVDEAADVFEPDLLQLHGRETPERAAEIGRRTGLPIMKALPIGSADDLRAIETWRGCADRILLDARPPRGADRPGGHGRAFDWRILAGLDPGPNLVLSGGLTPENVGRALATTGVAAVDVSSGVESRPGEKDAARIAAFVRAARAAADGPQATRRSA